MSRIRVLRVIARMNVGGPALQVATLTAGLDPSHFESRLLTGSVEPREADFLDLRRSDIDAIRVPGLGRAPRPLDDARALAGIAREIRAFRPHVVHTHTAKAGVLGRAAAKGLGVPALVHTFHGHTLNGYFPPLVTAGVVRVERTLARVTDALVSVGTRVRDELLAAGIGRAAQYHVVPPGIPVRTPPSRDEARHALGLDHPGPVVSYVGRVTGVKRPDRLLEVARLVHDRRPDAVFLVVGEGDLLDRTRAAAAGAGDGIRFLGWRDDVEVVHAASDAALLTSDNEGMPVSLIEAARCGTPAVSTAVGSAAEVVEDGVSGYVCPADAPRLADAVLRLLDDDGLRQKMGVAAAELAADRFGPERLVRDTEAIYERVLGTVARR